MDICGYFFILITYFCLSYAYYVIIGVLIVPLMNETLWGIFNGIVFTVLIILSMIAHLRTCFSNPGYVSLVNINIDFSDLHSNADSTISLKNDQNGSAVDQNFENMNVCSRCEIYRPADSHHCRICKRCIRKRHHHCHWLNNCIGEYNQRYFIQFLFYIAVLSVYTIVFILLSLIMYPEESLTYNLTLNHSLRVYHSIIVILECILFGIFVFKIMCEQVKSITSDRICLANNIGISYNQLLERYQLEKQNLELESSSFILITHIKRLYFLFESLKQNSYFNYAKFKLVFKTNNPLLWLIPYEMESLFGGNENNMNKTQSSYFYNV